MDRTMDTTFRRIPSLPPPGTFRDRLKEISMFFNETDFVHQTMRRVVEQLD